MPLRKKNPCKNKHACFLSLLFFLFHFRPIARRVMGILFLAILTLVVLGTALFIFVQLRWLKRVYLCKKLYDLGWTLITSSHCGYCIKQYSILGPVCAHVLGTISCDCLAPTKDGSKPECNSLCTALKDAGKLMFPMWVCLDTQTRKHITLYSPGVKTWKDLYLLANRPIAPVASMVDKVPPPPPSSQPQTQPTPSPQPAQSVDSPPLQDTNHAPTLSSPSTTSATA